MCSLIFFFSLNPSWRSWCQIQLLSLRGTKNIGSTHCSTLVLPCPMLTAYTSWNRNMTFTFMPWRSPWIDTTGACEFKSLPLTLSDISNHVVISLENFRSQIQERTTFVNRWLKTLYVPCNKNEAIRRRFRLSGDDCIIMKFSNHNFKECIFFTMLSISFLFMHEL